jgi:ppGpp synthetase/RelA/SpoT-type nucleotidyltranferase
MHIWISEKFKAEFNVKYVNNYLVNAKEDGYRGYHLYVESPIDRDKLIEIQLRTVTAHKWASLVEIIDILYNLKLKVKKVKSSKNFSSYIKEKYINN